jgi:hypothetical protein
MVSDKFAVPGGGGGSGIAASALTGVETPFAAVRAWRCESSPEHAHTANKTSHRMLRP